MMRFFSLAERKAILLSGVSGLLLTLSFPRYGFGPVAWVALIPLFFVIESSGPAACFKFGWFAGVVHGLTLLYWIVFVANYYGNLSFVASAAACFLLVAYLALYPAFFCAGLTWLRLRRVPWPFVAPFLWVALELGRGWLLTGFPWENLGYSQYRLLPLIQIAEITGVSGLSFLLVLVNVVLFQALVSATKQRRLPRFCLWMSLVGAIILGQYGYGRWRLHTLEAPSSAPSVKVSLIQGNIPQDVKWEPAFQQETLERYLRLTRKAVEQERPELVVWPETATPFYFLAEGELSSRVIQEVQALKTPLLFGSPALRRLGDRLKFYNRAYLLDEYGRVLGYYDKRHLVPFGEYVPLQNILFFVHRLVEATGDFASGDRPVVMTLPPARLGVLICYEAIFPELSRDLVTHGANLLVNITNDAWFGRTSAPYQHLSMAVLRTVEFRVPMARCANTGISALIDPCGRILRETGLFEETTLTGSLPLVSGETFYCRHGEWLAVSCLLVTALFFGIPLFRRLR
jgi:apolipoprotein N-acyltransferase